MELIDRKTCKLKRKWKVKSGTAASDDDVPGCVLKVINSICKTGEWLEDFIEVKMIT
jgi:hypothetical protein